MMNRKGDISLEGAGNVILVVIFCLFILAIIAATFGGFGSDQDNARQAAVDIADGITLMDEIGPIVEVEVDLAEGWSIYFDSEENLIQVLEDGKPNEAYRFSMPKGFDLVCCPKFDTSKSACANYCPDSFEIEGKLDDTFCVATWAKIDTVGGGLLQQVISNAIHGKGSKVYVYPKGITCTTAAF